MNQIFKSLSAYIRSALVTISAALFILPGLSFAFTSQASAVGRANVAKPTTGSSEFCINLTNEENNVNQRLSREITNAQQQTSNKSQFWQNIWNKVDNNVQMDRQNADQKRNLQFSQLKSKAKNSAEQQAVQAYIAAVTSAINTRRYSYDAARLAFRTGIEAAITSRSSTISTQLSGFQETVDAVFATAKTSCDINPSSGQAYRSQLQSALKTARITFSTERTSDATVGSQVKQLVIVRNNSFKAADQVFHTSMQSARQTLIAAFKSAGNSGNID